MLLKLLNVTKQDFPLIREALLCFLCALFNNFGSFLLLLKISYGVYYRTILRIKIEKHPSKRVLVPVVGVEPTRYCYLRILSPTRLPIPPYRHMVRFSVAANIIAQTMEKINIFLKNKYFFIKPKNILFFYKKYSII